MDWRFYAHHLTHTQAAEPTFPLSLVGLHKVVRIRGTGGAGGLCGSLVVGRGGYRYFLSGYVLLECNLTGLVIISM